MPDLQATVMHEYEYFQYEYVITCIVNSNVQHKLTKSGVRGSEFSVETQAYTVTSSAIIIVSDRYRPRQPGR